MDGQSRIKFNPATQEIEIEGSENFVKIYFDKIQTLFSETQGAVAQAPLEQKLVKAIKEKPVKMKAAKGKPGKEPPAKKVRQSKKAPEVITELKRGNISNTVLALIQDSLEGITTAELKEKTGLKARQIWAVVLRGEKTGKVKKLKRGVYVAS